MYHTNYRTVHLAGLRKLTFWGPLLLLCLVACEKNSDPVVSSEDGKLQVVTTVAPITSMVENVAGDKIHLTGIVPEGMNSHTFEPVPSDVQILSGADLIILNGLDLEIPTLKLAQAGKKSGASLLLLGNRTVTEKDYVFDFSFPKDRGHPNPHLWPDPRYAIAYAELIRDELIRLDPANRSQYEKNTATYIDRLRTLDDAIQRDVYTIPTQNRRLLTYHDSWPYFARRYGFQIIGAVQPSDFSDPSPREVARLIDQLRREQVPAVFGSEVFPSPVLKQIAREGGSKFIDSLRDDDLPGTPGDPRHSYVGMMLENLRTMFLALGGSTEALDTVDPTPVAGSHADYRSAE
ncbi:MAG: zinc ABC transporter solute-binding protein [Deltaproteobacteria bacterium]|nr:zinc ABC transporter solute-binding protein [Deltaproteobacteria bacterium]